MGVQSTVSSIIHYSHSGVKDKRHGRRYHERSIDPRLEIYISTGDPTTATDGYDTDSAAVSDVLSSVFISTFDKSKFSSFLHIDVEYLDKRYSVTIKSYSQRERVNRSTGKKSLTASTSH